MRTVKEVTALTGVSVRTLHYYDEIGLLKPATATAAGYRLYDESNLERLQQILYFREFDLALREIRGILTNSSFDLSCTLILNYKEFLYRNNCAAPPPSFAWQVGDERVPLTFLISFHILQL